MTKSNLAPIDIAHFRFALIAPVIQHTYSEPSASAYYRRVTSTPLTLPDGSVFHYQPTTLEKWVEYYKKGGIDALMPKARSDKGSTRTLTDTAIEEIYRLKQKFPRLNATQIHQRLIQDGFLPASVSVASVQRFIKRNDLKSARNLMVKDRKAFEEEFFGALWQADTCYLPHICENGRNRRTYLIMIIDDHSRLIVGGQIFYNDNAYNFQTVLKNAIASYGIPHKLYLDNGSPYKNDQLTLICGSVGTLELHTPVRDGASKGKVERNFRTLKNRWLYGLDTSAITSLKEFNEELAAYIRRHNTTIHSTTRQTPLDRFLLTKGRIQTPKSPEWLSECFHNRITRKVNNDSCISIDGTYYDAPQQFIGMKVEIRFLPGSMDQAYILYEGIHFPIRPTNKFENARTKRNHDLPTIDYSRKEDTHV